MSIRVASMAIGALTFLLVGALSGWMLWNAIGEARSSRYELQTARLQAELNSTVIELSFERSVAQVSLALDAPVAARYRDLIDRQRQITGDGFAAVAAVTGSGSRYAEFHAEFTAALAEIEALRAEADRQLTLPIAERDPEFAVRWSTEVPNVIARLEGMGSRLHGGDTMVPVSVLTLSELRHLSWAIREYGGRERTLLAIATARQEIPDDSVVAKMRALNETVERRRDSVELLRDAVPDHVRARIDALEAGYFTDYAAMRQTLLSEIEAGREGGFSVSFDAYFEKSGEALRSAERLAEAAIAEVITQWEDLFAAARLKLVVLSAITAGALLFSLATWLYLSRAVAARLRRVVERIEVVASGDYEGGSADAADLPREGTAEVPSLARAIETLRENLLRARHAEKRAEEERRATAQAREDSLREIADNVETRTRDFVEQTGAEVDTMLDGTQRMSDSSREVGLTAEEIASATGQMLEVARGLDTTLAELTEAVGGIGTRAETTIRVVSAADQAGGKMAEQINALAQAVQRIGSVTELIATVASQTNLLALNASVEAARAGDAGRGFAVVANEVKLLANQTSHSATEIASIVETVRTLTQSAVETVAGMVEANGQARGAAVEIGEAVKRQRAAADAIAGAAQTVLQQSAATATRTSAMKDSARRNQELAVGVDASAEALRATLGQMRDQLVQVVRTSSPEVEGRTESRYRGSGDCVLILRDGRMLPAPVIGLSSQGVRVVAPPGVADGRSVHRIRLGATEISISASYLEGDELRCLFAVKQSDEDLARMTGSLRPVARAA